MTETTHETDRPIDEQAKDFVHEWIAEHEDARTLFTEAFEKIEAGELTWVDVAQLIQEAEMLAFLKFLDSLDPQQLR